MKTVFSSTPWASAEFLEVERGLLRQVQQRTAGARASEQRTGEEGTEKLVPCAAETHLLQAWECGVGASGWPGGAWGLPCRLFPLVLVQVGGGEVWGLTTGAKALFCFTAETMLAGEKEKMPEELLQLEGRLVEEAMVGLDGTTGRGNGKAEISSFPGIPTQGGPDCPSSMNAQELVCFHHLVQVLGTCYLLLVAIFFVFIVSLLCARSMLGTGVPQARGQSALTRVGVAQKSN